MVIILKDNIKEAQIDELIKWIQTFDVQTNLINGLHSKIIGLIGDTTKIDMESIQAKEIVEELVQTDITSRIKDIAVLGAPKPKAKKYDDVDLAQMSLFDTVKDDDVLKELKELDLGNLTPIEALNTLYQLQNKLKNRW
mgnify:CR=1 FL=1